MSEELGTQLDPDLRPASLFKPYAERLRLRPYSPLRWARRFGASSLEAAQVGRDLPQQVRGLTASLERGDVAIGMRPASLEPLLRRSERMVNRLVSGMLASASTVTLAVLLPVYRLQG